MDPWRAWAGIEEDDEEVDPTPVEQWEYTSPGEAYMTDSAYETRRTEQ